MQNQQLFEQLIQRMVLTDYQKKQYGRYVLLSAHIHAMEESKIISKADVLGNLSEFTRLLTMILGEIVCYKKFHQQYHNPTHHQFDMIDEYKEVYMDYKNKEVCMIPSHRWAQMDTETRNMLKDNIDNSRDNIDNAE